MEPTFSNKGSWNSEQDLSYTSILGEPTSTFHAPGAQSGPWEEQSQLLWRQPSSRNAVRKSIPKVEAREAGIHITLIINSVCLLVALLVYVLCLCRLRIFQARRTSADQNNHATTHQQRDNQVRIVLHNDTDKRDTTPETHSHHHQDEEEEDDDDIDTHESEPMLPNSPHTKKPSRTSSVLRPLYNLFLSIWHEQQYHSFGAFYGHQITLYLFLSKQITIALGICSFLACAVLLPLHLTGVTPTRQVNTEYGSWKLAKDDYFLVHTTISMVVDQPVKMYAHVVMALVFVVVVLLFLRRFTESRLVKDYPLDSSKLLSDYSARLDELPSQLTSNHLLKEACNLDQIFDGSVTNSRITFQTAARIKLQKEYSTVSKRLKHYTVLHQYRLKRASSKSLWDSLRTCCHLRGTSRPRIWIMKKYMRVFPVFVRTDAISYYQAEKQRLETAMRSWDETFLENPSGTGTAYLLFQSQQAKERAIQKGESGRVRFSIDLTGSKKPKNLSNVSFVISRAAEPSDILWENSNISKESRFARMVVVNFFIIIYLMVFSSPLTLISSLQSFLDLLPSNVHNSLDSLRHISGPLGDLVYQYLPTLLLLILTCSLPYVIPFLTALEKYYTYSNYAMNTIYRLYIYLVLTTLILPTFALTSMEGLLRYLQFKNISQSLQNIFLPGSGVFFVNYCIQYLFWGTIIDLLRLGDVIRYAWKSLSAVGEEEKREAAQVAEFDFPLEYGYLLSFFAIAFTYGVFSPVIIVLGFIYFLTKYLLDVRNIVYLCAKNKNSRHNVMPDAVNYKRNIMLLAYIVFSVVLMFELYNIMFYAKAGEQCHIHLAIMVTTLASTLIYMLYWSLTFNLNTSKQKKRWSREKRHKRLSQNLFASQDDLSEQAAEPFMSSTENSSMEVHPMELRIKQEQFDLAYVPPFAPIYDVEDTVKGLKGTQKQEAAASKEMKEGDASRGTNTTSPTEQLLPLDDL